MKFAGAGGAPGFALGPAVIWKPGEPESIPRLGAGVPVELARLDSAVLKSTRELETIAEAMETSTGAKEAAIFRVHCEMLRDPALLDVARETIELKAASAENAVVQATSALAAQFGALGDATLRERGADVTDIGRRLLNNLSGGQRRKCDGIVVARDLSPSEVSILAHAKTPGVVTEEGTVAGHAAILARALGVPAVVGVDGALSKVQEGDVLAIDGESGEVIVNPDALVLEEFARRRAAWQRNQAGIREMRYSAAETLDGRRVGIYANIGSADEVDAALDAGAEGIGLFRTEYLFIGRPDLPSEEEQFAAYRSVLTRMGSRQVVIRTIDLGADKRAPALGLAAEANPALGLRGIRLAFAHPEIFRCQLRALVRASGSGNLAVMLPMVSIVEEVREFRVLLAAVQEELGIFTPIRVGSMVETPAAAIAAEEFIAATDFLSIGTNDLTQYVLAVDRLNLAVASLYQPQHPAVLELIQRVAKAAARAGKPAGVCGEMAADPGTASLLVNMGILELSMTAAAIPAVKDAIRRISSGALPQAAV